MNPQSRPMVILAALIGVMVLVYAQALQPRRAAPSSRTAPAVAAAPAAPASTAPQRAAGADAASRSAQRARAAQLAWDRDPFLQGKTTGMTGDLTLSGILWDASQPLAIINGQMLRVGDELEGYRVTAITQDHVSVTDGTQTLQLPVAP